MHEQLFMCDSLGVLQQPPLNQLGLLALPPLLLPLGQTHTIHNVILKLLNNCFPNFMLEFGKVLSKIGLCVGTSFKKVIEKG